jgi:hypothetical protein
MGGEVREDQKSDELEARLGFGSRIQGGVEGDRRFTFYKGREVWAMFFNSSDGCLTPSKG